jgi:hypothetical protein
MIDLGSLPFDGSMGCLPTACPRGRLGGYPGRPSVARATAPTGAFTSGSKERSVVKIKGRKVADVKGVKRLKKGVTLKKLPSGAYKISVLAITVLNQRLSGSRTYHSCTKSSGVIKLHGGKSNKRH